MYYKHSTSMFTLLPSIPLVWMCYRAGTVLIKTSIKDPLNIGK